ncbi:hypothetical protein HF086_000254 [Spodoptera exigua]|uniref:PHD-type domain-containing protein n=1 Tax=Spodoptera exigua TaxID=7107 RepID=A0A922M7N1_SPOEX|nr:hypothetical protein HF086_000254 [Spodoptera exigua]
MSNSCSHCNEGVGSRAPALICCTCKDMYHCECLNITPQQFVGFSQEQKAEWKCHSCSNITQRGRHNSTSLNCSVYIPANYEDAINMSCDNLEQLSGSPNPSSSTPSTIVTGTASNSPEIDSVGIISQELNKTLKDWSSDMDHKIAKFTNDIKTTLHCWREEMMISIAEMKENFQHSITDMKQEMVSLRSEQDKLKEHVSTVAHDVSELKSSVQFQAAENNDLRDRVENITRHSSEQTQSIVRTLEQKIDSLEQQARNCNIEISNVPERRGEDLIRMMEQMGAAVKFAIQQKDIISIHRVQHAQHTSNRPKNIIVKFSTRITRDNFLSAYRLAKELKSDQIGITGSPARIYLNEHLTLKTKQLFRTCKEAAKQHDFKYVWIRNSTILVRERDGMASFAVRTLDDIRKITSGVKTATVTTQNTVL